MSHRLRQPVNQVQVDLIAMARETINRAIGDGNRQVVTIHLGNNYYSEEYSNALILAAREHRVLLPESNIFVIEDIYRDLPGVMKAVARLKSKSLAILTSATLISEHCLSWALANKLACFHYTIFTERSINPGIASLNTEQQRLGLVGVDRLCHIIDRDSPDFRDPYLCLLPPVGWTDRPVEG